MHVYPNPDSWDEFYPSDIFIALDAGETLNAVINVFVKANIGATIVMGKNGTESLAYKKVGDIEALADLSSSLILLSATKDPNPG